VISIESLMGERNKIERACPVDNRTYKHKKTAIYSGFFMCLTFIL